MTIKEIIFDSSLYQRFKNDVQIDKEGELMDYTLDYLIREFNERVEMYCTECDSRRIFATDKSVYSDTSRVSNIHFPQTQIKNKPSLFKSFRCSQNEHHSIHYGFLVDNTELVKISEYPSKYDSVKDTFNKFKKILDKSYITELSKAAQLESFGYAIAAFLYYRRIFEHLIIKTFKETEIPDKVTEDEFRKKRMEDKISYIKEYLPAYFNDNSHIYGILSKGIHELSEEECQKHLSIVKTIIFFSLEEALEIRNKELRKEEFSKKLNEINTDLK